jgi:integral membrane protein
MIETTSFLVLLGIAMPLKYLAGKPEAVKFVGWAHGILFVVFCFALLRAMLAGRWGIPRATLVFVAALVPFGPFLIDRRMRGYEKEHQGMHIRELSGLDE